MNRRFLSVLAFALVVSLGASYLLYRFVLARLNTAAPDPTTTIVVASKDLAIGALTKEADLKLEGWRGPVPNGAIPKVQDAIDRGVIANIYAGEPVVETRLAPKGGGAGLAATIPKGMRAVALPVNDIVGVAGFVVPGMSVDVLISGTAPNTPATVGTVTKTLLQNIQVLSAGQNMQKDAEGKPVSVAVINVLVTPEQAEILSLASAETRIQLVLRNPLDREIVKTAGTAKVALFTGSPFKLPGSEAPVAPSRRALAPRPIAAPPPPAKPPAPLIIEIYHGNVKNQAQFKQAEEKTN